MKLAYVLLAVSVALGTLAGVADANNKDKAEAQFKRGKQLMADKRYADACEAFEKSFKLDPGIGTQLNIAKCYEEWGKIGRAFLSYQAAEKMAKDASDPREPKIRELIVALEPEIPHLTIKAPANAPSDLEVTLDRRPVEKLGEPFVIDPGPHTIEWWITGSPKKTKIVVVDRGGESEVSIDIPVVPSRKDTFVAAPVAPAGPPPGRNQRLAGIAVGGAGILAIGVSSYMTLSARGDYNDALDAHCGGMTNNCDMTGLEITRDARSTANKATIVFFAGVALVGGGAALYFLAPKGPERSAERAVYVTPAVNPDGVGIVVGGTL
jgi:tetratricopeptide (TPR) repeat protein